MVQVLRRPQSAQELLATGLGQGLGQGVQNLAQQKLQNMQQQRLQQALQATPGYSQQESSLLPLLSPQAQSAFVKEKLRQPGTQELINQYTQFLSPTGQEVTEQVEGVEGPQGTPTFDVKKILGTARTPQEAKGLVDTALKQQKLGLEQQKAEKKDLTEREKHISTKMEGLRSQYDTATENLNNNEILRTLNNSGQLSQGLTAAVAQKLNLPISLWGNSPTEVASKLVEQNIMRGAADIGKGRGAGAKMLQLLRSAYPTLSNTRQGMDLILDANDLISKMRKELYEEADQLKDAYQQKGEKLPFDLIDKARKNINPRYENRFKVYNQKLNRQLKPQPEFPKQKSGDRIIDEETGYIAQWGPNGYEIVGVQGEV